MTDELQLLAPADFPRFARDIGSSKQLYLRGKLSSFGHKWLSVVGSRAMTTYGKQACHHLVRGLAWLSYCYR